MAKRRYGGGGDGTDDTSNKRQKKKSWQEQMFDDFIATEGHHNDHAETCTAKILYKDDAGQDQVLTGSTGKGAGHAEMHALDQFLRNVCDNGSAEIFEKIKKKGLRVECPAKPCCVRCSIVLGALGFIGVEGSYNYRAGSYEKIKGRTKWVSSGDLMTKTANTLKTRKTMGSTQWGLTPTMRKNLCKVSTLTEDRITDISNMKNL